MKNHLPRVLIVAPHTEARRIGLKDELHIGWKHNFNGMVWWWGSCANRTALKKLIADAKKKYGELTVEERDTDQAPMAVLEN